MNKIFATDFELTPMADSVYRTNLKLDGECIAMLYLVEGSAENLRDTLDKALPSYEMVQTREVHEEIEDDDNFPDRVHVLAALDHFLKERYDGAEMRLMLCLLRYGRLTGREITERAGTKAANVYGIAKRLPLVDIYEPGTLDELESVYDLNLDKLFNEDSEE